MPKYRRVRTADPGTPVPVPQVPTLLSELIVLFLVRRAALGGLIQRARIQHNALKSSNPTEFFVSVVTFCSILIQIDSNKP
jgi:hypothetical protein